MWNRLISAAKSPAVRRTAAGLALIASTSLLGNLLPEERGWISDFVGVVYPLFISGGSVGNNTIPGK